MRRARGDSYFQQYYVVAVCRSRPATIGDDVGSAEPASDIRAGGIELVGLQDRDGDDSLAVWTLYNQNRVPDSAPVAPPPLCCIEGTNVAGATHFKHGSNSWCSLDHRSRPSAQ